MATMTARWVAIGFLVLMSSLPALAGVPWPEGATTNAAVEVEDPPPIGLYCVDPTDTPPYRDVTQEFDGIAAAGFGFMQSYQFEEDPATVSNDPKEFLKAAGNHGLKVLMGIPRQCVVNGDIRCIQERVAAVADNPALFAYQLFDEPDGIRLPPATLEAAYNAIKAIDPVHPVSIATASSVDQVIPYVNAFDISIPQWLFPPLEDFFTSGYKEVFEQEIATLTALEPPKSFIHALTVYNVANDHVVCPQREASEWAACRVGYPTREDMRFLAYFAVIHGTLVDRSGGQSRKGLLFNCYRYYYGPDAPAWSRDDISPSGNPPQWARVSSVALELRFMEHILAAPTQERQSAGVSFGRVAPITPVELLIKQYEGRTYLLTVNPSSAPVQLQIHLSPDRFPNPAIALLPERQSIPFQDGFFTAVWDRYGVAVFEIHPGTPPDVEDPSCDQNACPPVSPDASPPISPDVSRRTKPTLNAP